MEWFEEVFGSIADAIGKSAGEGYRVTKEVKTKNRRIAEQRFRRTIYVESPDGKQWTVHHDRTKGLYAGAHWSSE